MAHSETVARSVLRPTFHDNFQTAARPIFATDGGTAARPTFAGIPDCRFLFDPARESGIPAESDATREPGFLLRRCVSD